MAAVVRLLLREDNAGMLRVRGRIFDVVALSLLGVAPIVLARKHSRPTRPLIARRSVTQASARPR